MLVIRQKPHKLLRKIRNYYDYRYISACEAVWRLFRYEIQEKEPFVIRLPFHLVDEQHVVYGETSNVNDIVERAISHKSMFLGWMAANMSYPYTRKLTMSDDEIKQLCLMDIDKILRSYGKTLKDYPPMPFATEIDSSLLTERGSFFFVYGHGGTGKIFLWNLMSAEIRSRGDIVLNVAPSGIASLLLPNRRTAHSRFKIPLNITEDSVCNIKPGSPQAMLLLKAKLIIWDETPMVSRYCYEVPDKCLGDIMRCSPTYSKDLPFGGKVVVLGGDFKQILHVIPRGSRQDIVHSTVNSSYLWKFCQVLKLTKNMRLSVETTASDQDETEQFGEWLLKVGDGLIGDNMDVNMRYVFQEIFGLCNGTRLQVRKFGNHVIECEVLTGNNVSHIALIPRMNMVPTNETVPVRFQRRQFPIIVSFAMTINKSQGQTLSHVGLCFPKPIFTHDQLYVALSRVKSKRGLKVLLMNHVGISANSIINVV
ncbi:uncharacterized protein LOC107607569 [Arachis ipaensis]|uniref:uncharacterized protein LOC107607569 n=1 Tax=Arachis ipaensis TaxID=130454 RepID=UPI0007AF0EA4|nr:uncharacterized protein LOC107607569 [Arachis ipaensis]